MPPVSTGGFIECALCKTPPVHPDGSANRNNYIWIKEITPNAKTESVFVTGATGNQEVQRSGIY